MWWYFVFGRHSSLVIILFWYMLKTIQPKLFWKNLSTGSIYGLHYALVHTLIQYMHNPILSLDKFSLSQLNSCIIIITFLVLYPFSSTMKHAIQGTPRQVCCFNGSRVKKNVKIFIALLRNTAHVALKSTYDAQVYELLKHMSICALLSKFSHTFRSDLLSHLSKIKARTRSLKYVTIFCLF